ncbi:ParB/RepB/Spo0J family partition protein [Nitrosospira multiformis]|uniref:ParB/RepB/Spo0J family partition protein n=1 Tax=Nitrosospira multiformis TaxID=1231 RepID=UPI0008994685|nr:ParB/RepB/Spo0J family partition protein [Nitrosospira multiformis]SEA65278.1 chromosome partitioning protein, ParB family [Nitrosospira multiformis]
MVKAKKKTNDQPGQSIAPPLNESGQEPVSISHNPIELSLDLIDEDPDQPRTVFDPQLLQELADTIRERGVKNPISVHSNTEKSGRYIINDGARRYRASKMAGKQTIPAFVDPDFTKIDQIIVNAHHANFTPREWAILIDQEEKKGKQRIQIAKELGKTPPFVTYYSNLLKLPEPLAEVFNSGRCEDVSALTQLFTVWKLYPDDVELWLDDSTVEVTRHSIRSLRDFLDRRAEQESSPELISQEIQLEAESTSRERKRRTTNPFKLRKPAVQVRVEDRIGFLLYNRRPSRFGRAWIRYQDNGEERELAMSDVQLVGLAEGE